VEQWGESVTLNPNIVKPVIGLALLIGLGVVWVLFDRSAHSPPPPPPAVRARSTHTGL
jgi:hypothetical protein